jgi:hypothetical protein
MRATNHAFFLKEMIRFIPKRGCRVFSRNVFALARPFPLTKNSSVFARNIVFGQISFQRNYTLGFRGKKTQMVEVEEYIRQKELVPSHLVHAEVEAFYE